MDHAPPLPENYCISMVICQIEKVSCGFSERGELSQRSSNCNLKSNMEFPSRAGYCTLGEPLQIGKIYFWAEEVVFCSAYKSRHITAPQASHYYKTFAKYTFFKILNIPFFK